MRRYRKKCCSKILALTAAAIALGGAGVTYGIWSKTLTVTGKLSTAVFNMAASAEGYQMSLANAQGTPYLALPGVEAQPSQDGKSVRLLFRSGVPMAALRDGAYLCLNVPLEGRQSTFTHIRRYAPDFTETAGIVTLQPVEIYLSIEGTTYLARNNACAMPETTADAPSSAIRTTPLDCFFQPLELAVYRAFDGAAEALQGSLYFGLTPESRTWLEGLPQELTVDRSILEQYYTLSAEQAPAEPVQGMTADGILVQYTCVVTLDIDQDHEPDRIARAGEGAALT